MASFLYEDSWNDWNQIYEKMSDIFPIEQKSHANLSIENSFIVTKVKSQNDESVVQELW